MKRLLLLFTLLASPCFAQLVITANLSGQVNAPIDGSGWSNFKAVLTQNITFSFVIVPPAPVPSQATMTVQFVQDAVGGRTVTFASNISATGCTVASGANAKTICQFTFDSANNQWTAVGGGGGGGISGQQDITKNGAVAGKSVTDGAMATTSSTFSANGSNTAPTTPSGTTTFNNEVIISMYSVNAAFTAPGTPTPRAAVAQAVGANEGLWMGDQTVASAGAYAANAGSTGTTQPWAAAAIPLIPTNGQTISFTASATNHATGSSVTVTFVATSGQTMIGCVAGFQGYTGLPGSGWNLIVAANNANTQNLTCFAKQAGNSEPGSYVFQGVPGATGGTFIAAGIAEYSNVAAIDNALTSVSAGWTPSIAGQTVCAEGFNSISAGFLNCSTISIVSGSSIYPLFTNTQTSAVTAKVVMWGPDSTSGFTGALTALGSAGGNIYIPPGIFFLTAGQLKLPYNTAVNIIGAGAQATVGNGLPANGAGGSFIVGLPDATNDPIIGFTICSNCSVQIYQVNDLIQGFTIRSEKSGTGNCINVGMEYTTLQKLDLIGCGNDGIQFLLNNSVYTGLNTVQWNLIEYCNNYGVNINTGTVGSNYVIYQNEMDLMGVGDINVTGQQQVTIVNNQLQFGGAAITVSNINSVPVVIGPGNWIDGGIQYSTSGGPGPDIFDNFFEIPNAIQLNGQIGAKITGNNFSLGAPFNGASTQKNLTMDATNTGAGFTTSFSGTSGTASCVFGIQGGQTKATCFLNGYAETGAAQTWTYPLAMATSPFLTESGGSCGAQNPSTSATVLTLPANAGMTAETCQIVVEGQTN